MSKKFYAVQHGNDFASDYGSNVKREAMKMARELGKDFPEEEIRICVCREDDDFCEEEIIVREGNRF